MPWVAAGRRSRLARSSARAALSCIYAFAARDKVRYAHPARAVCIPEAAGWCQKPQSGVRAARERLPSGSARESRLARARRTCGVHGATCDTSARYPCMLK